MLADKGWRLLIADPTVKTPYYQGTRFALSGMVVQATLEGFSIFTEVSLDKEPTFHDNAGGNADEYDIDGPPGSDRLEAGSEFVKIGVGLLRKIKPAGYRFSARYEVLARPRITVNQREREIEFLEVLDLPDQQVRYSLKVLVKILEDGSGFSIDRDLTNLGESRLETTIYSHNFCRFGISEIGSDYVVESPETVQWQVIKSSGGILLPTPHSLKFTGPPLDGDFHAEAHSANADSALREVSVVHKDYGVALQVTTNRDLQKFAVWGQTDKIAVEPFVQLSIPEGQTANLRTTYRLFKQRKRREH